MNSIDKIPGITKQNYGYQITKRGLYYLILISGHESRHTYNSPRTYWSCLLTISSIMHEQA